MNSRSNPSPWIIDTMYFVLAQPVFKRSVLICDFTRLFNSLSYMVLPTIHIDKSLQVSRITINCQVSLPQSFILNDIDCLFLQSQVIL